MAGWARTGPFTRPKLRPLACGNGSSRPEADTRWLTREMCKLRIAAGIELCHVLHVDHNMEGSMQIRIIGLVIAALTLTVAPILEAQATNVEMACTFCGKKSPRGSCARAVTALHPDLKGNARKSEIDKCVSNPDKYNT